MCGKAVHTFLPTLKFVSNWFNTNKMLKILAGVVLSNNDIVFVNEDSSNVRFLSECILMLYAIQWILMDLKAIYLRIINLDYDNFYDDPKSITQVHLMACCNRYKQRITCKKET